MADDVIVLNARRAERADDNTLLSPLECLEEVAREIRAGEIAPKRVLILLVDDSDGYGFAYRAAQMKCSEMLALLAVGKARVLSAMGFGPE